MKKTVAFILSLALASSLSFSAFADAHSGTQAVTTTKSASTFSLIVPAATSIPWGTTEYFKLGDFTLKVGSDFDVDNKAIKIDWGGFDGEFTSTTPGVTTIIPYKLVYDPDQSEPYSYAVMSRFPIGADGFRTVQTSLKMLVERAAWEAAQAGDYTTSVTYTASVVDKLPWM